MEPRVPSQNDGGPAIIEATHEAAHEEDGDEGVWPTSPHSPVAHQTISTDGFSQLGAPRWAHQRRSQDFIFVYFGRE